VPLTAIRPSGKRSVKTKLRTNFQFRVPPPIKKLNVLLGFFFARLKPDAGAVQRIDALVNSLPILRSYRFPH
jgi:hypothetical protein